MTHNRRCWLGGRGSRLLRLALMLAAIYALWLAQAWQPAHAGDTWIACSVRSYHVDRTRGYNERNLGCGLEHGVARDTRLVAGAYRNSLFKTSTYAGALWMPLSLGPASVGLIGGVVNGYRANDGRFSPIVLPMLALEHRSIGINLFAAPHYKESPAVFGLQIKVLLPL